MAPISMPTNPGRCAEIALAVALAVVLGLFRIPLPHLLYGGSISLDAVPIMLVALHRGSATGTLAGVTYGMVNFMIRPIIVHPVQLVLDYPVAYGLLGGGCGLLHVRSIRWKTLAPWRRQLILITGLLVGNGLRLTSHWVSGVVFFADYAPPGQPVWLYSLLYNASYIIPQIVIHIILSQFMIKILIARHGNQGEG